MITIRRDQVTAALRALFSPEDAASRRPLSLCALAALSGLLLLALLGLGVYGARTDRRVGQFAPVGVRSAAGDAPGAELLLARPVAERVRAQGGLTLCLQVYTGTVRSTYVISNPQGISGFQERTLANFSQRLLERSPTAIKIEVTTSRWLDTRAPYPVDVAALPEDVLPLLRPDPGWIQSDHPQIVAKAQELVRGARREAQAVEAIVAWVRGNTRWELGHNSDALSVFTSGTGVCAGFSTLTAALLRAAGIPARSNGGCVARWGDGWGWVVGDAGGGHAWNEVYYPDVGWIALDPQVTVNYLDAGHILSGFDQCGGEGTVITRTHHQADEGYLYGLRTDYSASPWPGLWAASVPAWQRHSLRTVPSVDVMLPVASPQGTLGVPVENLGCSGQDWQARSSASWLSPSLVTGTVAGMATLAVDGRGLPVGMYSTTIVLYATSSPWSYPWAISRTVTARLWLVEQVHRLFCPLLAQKD